MDPAMRLPSGAAVPLAALETDRAARCRYLAAPYRAGSRRVTCLCTDGGVTMGIACRRVPVETYYLYPLHRADVERHADECPHARRRRPSARRKESLPDVQVLDGRIRVNLAGVSSRSDTVEAGQGGRELGPRRPPHEGPAARAALRTLLATLWMEAGLHLWRPQFRGRRPYRVVRARLLRAAERIDVRTQPLRERFYVPTPYDGNPEAAHAAWDAFVASLAPVAGRRPFGYGLGGVLAWHAPQGRLEGVRLTHVGRTVWFEPDLKRRLATATDTVAQPVALVLMKLRVCRGSSYTGLRAEDLALLPVADTETWLPAWHGPARELIRALVHAGRRFHVGWDDVGVPMARPIVAVLDDADAPAHLAVVRTRADRAWVRRAGRTLWVWNPATQRLPALPGRRYGDSRKSNSTSGE